MKAILEMPRPEDKKGLGHFLGCTGYYRKLIDNYSTIVSPLNTKMRRENIWTKDENGLSVWTDVENEAWDKIRGIWASEPVIAHPDWTQPFELHTDACDHGLGAVLSQIQDGKEKVIHYASRSLTLGGPESRRQI